MLCSVSGDLYRLNTSVLPAVPVAEAAGFATNRNEGDYLEKLQLSVLCWAELTK